MVETVISYEVASGWIGQLAKAYGRLAKKRKEELDKIGNLCGPPREIAKYYIEPDCQQTNPADKDEEQAISYVRGPVLKTITHFLSSGISSQQSDRHMFVLSDAGMGKSSLLIMLKLTHMSAFWPSGYGCQLLKLGEDTIPRIRQMEGKHNTVLLLDSLDEDPAAWSDTRGRLVSLLDETSRFSRVIITCRTQFFPTTEKDVLERPGYVKVGGYACPSIYLSLFSEDQIHKYLAKRFPRSVWQALLSKDHPKYAKAKQAVYKMRSLRCRPMLLAHVESILDGKRDCETELDMYDVLVRQWLDREEIKARKRGDSLRADELKEASTVVALALQKSGLRILPASELKRLRQSSPVLNKLELLQISGRSLLNRTSEGEYRFAHYTIQEFLVAKALAAKKTPKDREQLRVTPFLAQMYLQSANLHIGNELVWIPGGEFRMGSTEAGDGGPLHDVTVRGFCMARYPVTNGQYRRFLEANPTMSKPKLWNDPTFNQPRQPVVGVSWDDARAYCDWAGLRLPSEAEWEHACRAGTTTRYSSGDTDADLAKAGWYAGNSGGRLHSVGEKEPNPFGLYDMHGNVCEWVEDDWQDNYDGAPTDGRAWVDKSRAESRVLRGGAWNFGAGVCRCAYRFYGHPGYRADALGFRPARSIP